MRIAIVINTSWNIYNFRKGLVLELMQQGHQIVAISPIDDYTSEIIKWGCEHVPINMTSTGTNLWREISILLRLRKVFKVKKIEMVLSFTIKANLYSILALRGLNIPIICNVSGFGAAFLVNDWKSKVAIYLYKRVFPFSDFIFFQNEDDKSDFIKYVSLTNSKTEVLPGSGIDLIFFSPKTYDKKSSITLVMISRLIIEKGILEYIEAAKMLSSPSLHFLLIGGYDPSHGRSITGDTFEEIKSASYITYIPHTYDVRPFIEKADAVVLPSYREGTPRTLLEAAAMQRPLIASDVPGCRQVAVNGYNAVLVDSQSAHSLINGIKFFVELSFNERKVLAENSRKHVENNYSQHIVINSYVNRINKLTGKKLGASVNN